MNDPFSSSKSAREALARGLNALQADPTVPPELVDLAAPIAQAMGALHQLEKTRDLAPHADIALGHVRGALQKLQAAPTQHAAVNQALEAVASSLTLVHGLSRLANAQVQTAPAPPVAPAPAAPVAPAPHPASAPHQQAAALAPTQGLSTNTAPIPPHQAPQGPIAGAPPYGQHAPYGQAPAAAPQAGHPQGSPGAYGQAPSPMVARDPFAAPVHAGPPPGAPGGAAGNAYAPPPPEGMRPATPSMPVPAPPGGGLPVVAADLGAHSPTNFYKGLAGNDVIDHGGIFISTYVPPKIGSGIRVKVSLPGGFEFEANAVVRWVREQGGDAPPGFGAQFTAITPEARQLVYRYVRNREPLFYDDL